MLSPRVSAITIFLNEQDFLPQAIESVLAQTFQEWELLLVDDGSTDGSSEIAQGFADRHSPRVRYATHPGRENRGMSASRNLGLSQAVGEFIAFLDGDDFWLPQKLAEQVAVMDSQPAAEMVYGRTLIWHNWNKNAVEQDFFYDLGVVPNCLYSPPRLLELLVENKVQTPTTCNALIRRALFGSVGAFEEDFRGMFEDQVFFSKVLLSASTYVDNRIWAKYRQHQKSASAMATSTGVDRLERFRFLEWLRRHLHARLPTHQRLQGLVDREIVRGRMVQGTMKS